MVTDGTNFDPFCQSNSISVTVQTHFTVLHCVKSEHLDWHFFLTKKIFKQSCNIQSDPNGTLYIKENRLFVGQMGHPRNNCRCNTSTIARFTMNKKNHFAMLRIEEG